MDQLKVQEKVEDVREKLSNVLAIQASGILLEFAFLLKQLVPVVYQTTFPALPAISTQSKDIYAPDVLVLFSSTYWYPFLTYFFLTLALPAAGGYFFNLTKGRKTKHIFQVDPVAFNVVKALIVYIVFTHGFRFGGLLGEQSVQTVLSGIGKEVLIVSSAVGATAGLYDAVLRK